ncbi:MAG: hypothetical protein OEX10_08580 [Candidatus Bathyarchaeota archaeon]|nr:hypothetical protein [Candidatus Bathyarchaeota archaeon]
MVRFVSITRWTPETARALQERWMTVINGTAPKAVLNAFAKIKVITNEVSLSNRFALMLFEIEEKDLVETVLLSIYMQDVCTQEEYTVMSMEDYLKASEALPMEKIPKPERWTK